MPNIGYQIKIWDFDFACIPGIVENMKVNASWTDKINVKPVQNRYYDMHYFFNTLIKRGFFPEFMTEDIIPKEAKKFVDRVVPPKYRSGNLVSKRGRVLTNDEYLTPIEVIRNDPFFDDFRHPVVKKKITSIAKVVDNDSKMSREISSVDKIDIKKISSRNR